MSAPALARVLVGVPVVALAACVAPDPQSSSADESAEALSRELGGHTDNDEAPAFGDATFADREFGAEVGVVHDESLGRLDLAGARHVTIALTWGYPRPRPEATERVDWSGSITVANAAVRVLRTLRFEEGSDVVVRPRTSIHVIDFESITGTHADGLLLDVVMAPVLNPSGAPVTLTFATAPYTATIRIAPDMRLIGRTTVDEAGHVVAYHVVRPDDDGCTEGFARGRWRVTGVVDGREVGRLHGVLATSDGRLRGYLRGLFGERENGHQVWFAKAIDREGRFLGIFAGRYGDGELGGLFIGRDRTVVGVIRGVYEPGDGERAGTFSARTSERCGEDAREGTTLEGDEPQIPLER